LCIPRKTTTLTEAVYQLARLHKYNKEQKKLKILLVAPSNDATDILVEKLASYFPPSEMLRVLAYSRSISQVPEAVRPYCREGLEPQQLLENWSSVQIVVATMNLAARFSNFGNTMGEERFDVVCVDEAGHATEPEVIGVVATLLKCGGNCPGQLIMAGDPNQLGPIITSDLCKKFGMDISYMERLVTTSTAYSSTNSGSGVTYPPELVTLLKRNYRSHPSILKLPNEMFYHNQLVACGDKMTTHSMAKWEHLPNKNDFPIIFHAIDGENLREGNSPSWFNPQEASVVVEYVDLLVKQSRPSVSPDDIGIITPYSRQVQKIQLALEKKGLGRVKTGSVETFQGQERRCIIISTVRSEQSLLSHDEKYNLGFVANKKRFNVAVTRAKALLIVIGNPRVLCSDTENWLPLLRYCRDSNAWRGEEWNEHDTTNDDDLSRLAEESAADDEWETVPDQMATGFINREE
jgi:superfamily I DNA and/or RNA helicase